MLCGLVIGESRKVIKDKETTPFLLRSPELQAKSEAINDLGSDNAKYTKVWDQIKAGGSQIQMHPEGVVYHFPIAIPANKSNVIFKPLFRNCPYLMGQNNKVL
jgi:hypothetical protein